MSDDIINMESRLVFRDVSKLTAGGMSTAAALAHAAHEAAERKSRMTTGFAQDDYIRDLNDRIAELDEEIAALKAELARAREMPDADAEHYKWLTRDRSDPPEEIARQGLGEIAQQGEEG